MPPVSAKVKTAARPKRKIAAKRAEYIEYKNVDRAAETAFYYGFTPLSEPFSVTKEDREQARELGERDERGSGAHCTLFPVEEKIALLRRYTEKRWFERPQPVQVCETLPASGTPKKKGGYARLGFDLLGTGSSIAEAILIQTARAVLKEEGCENTVVTLNSVGDRECMNRFVRELISFYRKNIHDLPAPCRALVRKNPVELLECQHDKCRLLSENAPKSLAFLSEGSRRHFKEVLEFLEELAIPFSLDQLLIGNRAIATETVFEIRDAGDEKGAAVLGVGMRYNLLARRLEGKREVPSAGVNLLLPPACRPHAGRAGSGRDGKGERVARRLRIRKPTVSFFQLGFEAKRKSLQVIEILREAGIALYHALAREKLISQIGGAEHLNIPYAIIMGQKEALADSVIVRDTATRAQETVKIAELPAYFKKLKLA